MIEHPNRESAASKSTRAIVVLLLLISAALLVVVTIGGWDTFVDGSARAGQVAFIVLYVVMALLIARWRRGLLPVAAALSIILLIFAVVSAPAWLDRDKAGYASPALDENVIALLVFILVPLQVLLIGFAMRGFAQAWNVEVERPADERRGPPAPQPA